MPSNSPVIVIGTTLPFSTLIGEADALAIKLNILNEFVLSQLIAGNIANMAVLPIGATVCPPGVSESYEHSFEIESNFYVDFSGQQLYRNKFSAMKIEMLHAIKSCATGMSNVTMAVANQHCTTLTYNGIYTTRVTYDIIKISWLD